MQASQRSCTCRFMTARLAFVHVRVASAGSHPDSVPCEAVWCISIKQMVAMASTAPSAGRCRSPLPFTDCSPSRPGPLSRQHGVAACRQPQRTVTCSAREGGHQQSVSEILRSAAVGLAAAASIALPMTMLPDQVSLPHSPPDPAPQIPSCLAQLRARFPHCATRTASERRSDLPVAADAARGGWPRVPGAREERPVTAAECAPHQRPLHQGDTGACCERSTPRWVWRTMPQQGVVGKIAHPSCCFLTAYCRAHMRSMTGNLVHGTQNQLEGISESLRIPGSKSLGPIQSVRGSARCAAAMCALGARHAATSGRSEACARRASHLVRRPSQGSGCTRKEAEPRKLDQIVCIAVTSPEPGLGTMS